jgi:hypothetical protein
MDHRIIDGPAVQACILAEVKQRFQGQAAENGIGCPVSISIGDVAEVAV